VAVAATSGIILGAAYMLWMFQRVMFGPISEVNTKMEDLNFREIAYFTPLLIMAIWIGLYPKPFMDIMDKPVEKLVQQVQPDFYKAEALATKQAEAAKVGMRGMEAEETKEHEVTPAGHGEPQNAPSGHAAEPSAETHAAPATPGGGH
jgi:NADH-quinone oxidoreductase subunit M